MKPFSLILILLFPLLGSVVQAQSGLTVFGDCSVSAEASIGFFGDQLTLNADLGGEGCVVMAGNKTQTIEADDKTVSRLVIANPTQVRVKGKLTIRQSLTVEKGTLEVLPQAHLHVEPTATVLVAAGAQLRPSGTVLQSGRAKTPLAKQPVFGPDALMVVVHSSNEAVFENRSFSHWLRTQNAYLAPSLPDPAMPPWFL